jgi:hypothetical protein
MTFFDPEAFEQHLSQARLDLAAVRFNPQKHPRDPLGRFREVLGGLKKGQMVQLPDGGTVKRIADDDKNVSYAAGNYQVQRGRGSEITSDPEAAAKVALMVSMENEDPKSFGGEDRYEKLDDAVAANASLADADERDRKQNERHKREGLGGRHKPKKGKKIKNPAAVGDMRQALLNMRRAGIAGTLSQTIDTVAYEAALEQERLNLAINFDPQKHPRDLQGRFRDILGHRAGKVEIRGPVVDVTPSAKDSFGRERDPFTVRKANDKIQVDDEEGEEMGQYEDLDTALDAIKKKLDDEMRARGRQSTHARSKAAGEHNRRLHRGGH